MAHPPHPPQPPTSRTVTVTTTRPAPAAPAPAAPASSPAMPPVMSQTSSPGTLLPAPGPVLPPSPGALLRSQRLADLLASVRDIAAINPLVGVISGPGNRGSANTAHLLGHAGTTGTFLGQPRSVGGPGIGGGQPV